MTMVVENALTVLFIIALLAEGWEGQVNVMGKWVIIFLYGKLASFGDR